MKRLNLLLPLFVLLLVLVAPAARGQSAPALLFIVDGQSNAGSQGHAEDLSPYWQDVGDQVLLYSPQFTGVKAFVSVPHVAVKGSWRNRYGVELSLYETIRDHYPGRVIVFARRSNGGGNISNWCSNTTCSGKQYTKVSDFRNAAVDQLKVQAGVDDVEIGGLIWLEIEADGRSMALASNYGARLEQLIASTRADVGNPQLPVLFMAPHTRQNNPTFAVLDAAVRDVAASVPQTAVIETIDLPTWEGLHFNSAGVLTFGQRLGAAWLDIQGLADSP